MAPSKWLVPLGQITRNRPTLVCTPYAGGGAVTFRAMRELSDLVDVYTVRYPGRESRLGEPALESVDALVAGLLGELQPLWQKVVLFGHSLGASVALELAHAVRRLRLPPPLAVIVSGRQPPSVPDEDPKLSHLPRYEFLKELRELEGTPPEFFAHEELIDLLLPALRADFAAAENYEAPQRLPLDCPLINYAGTDDDLPPETMTAWQKETIGPFKQRVFVGGHFFVQDTDKVLPALREDLRALL